MLDDQEPLDLEGDSDEERKAREERIEAYKEKELERRRRFFTYASVAYAVFFLVGGVFYYVTFGYFEFSQETVKTLNESINYSISLLPAMVFGMIGALCKLSMTGGELRTNLQGVVGSGVIALIAVLSFKSGLISIVANAYFSASSTEMEVVARTGGEYATILIALVSGMFAYNIFSLMKRAAEGAKLKDN